ncbi:hypothetical protein A1O1_08543 [Capronia coronata CBS 617.96]|uniref:Prephenate dehydratase n=1 Tax=Capronia coronata CBS 617.96 TaxID=1182541 RepID=W9YDM1_9EURO|nr:uncharacterized protein A1O1_08543 [Capronia coronata CBS 617.96]EXJ80399.1 hypothetical protein A1O1_08543 [Capronia coronata CBS 617.96]
MTEDGPPLNVAYLGPEASFSHQAAIEVFTPPPPPPPSSFQSPSCYSSQSTTAPPSRPVTLHPLPSFSAIFAAIQDANSNHGSAQSKEQGQPQISYDYAVVPIENSTNGSVVQVLDLLAQCGLDSGTTRSDSDSDSAAAVPVLYPDLEVCAEYYLPVHHCLFVAPSRLSVDATNDKNKNNDSNDSNKSNSTTTTNKAMQDPKTAIRILYTHPQVWGQCGRFLGTHFPPNVVERIDMGSTSAAAQLVAREATSTKVNGESGLSAAIASQLAGQKHNLVCLAENIEDEPGSNTTRFFVMRNRQRGQDQQSLFEGDSHFASGQSSHSQTEPLEKKKKTRYYKSLITFTIDHTRPGSLADALAVFKQYSYNLTSIDTRPSRKRNWQYVFFVECEEAFDAVGDRRDDDKEKKLRSMLQDLRKFTESLRYLGRFEDQLRSGVAHVQP